MNLQSITIILLAILIGVAYLLRVRNYDMYEKEPFFKLLLVMAMGGIIAIITSTVFYSFTPVKYNFLDAIIKVGIIEELSKFIALLIVYSFIKKDFNEIVDGLIYITAISLGFAVIENIFYAFNYENHYLILFQRSISAVIGHITFSGYMGIAFYIHKRIRKNYSGILISILIAAIAHGFYDGVLFHKELNFLFIFIFILLIILQFRVLKAALGFSEFREKIVAGLFTETGETHVQYCAACHKDFKNKTLKFHRIETSVCSECGEYTFNEKNVKHLFAYSRPILRIKSFMRRLRKKDIIVYLDDKKTISYDTRRKILSSEIDSLGEWLEQTNTTDRENLLNKPVIGLILKSIGLRTTELKPDTTFKPTIT
ncbi:PrsW family intramembrane metalloprotease [Saccharicrinis sp. FJH2]|uniref:PrsW family intramembrane metalloprotease n=1 Tax=Saccharicrinis sp. FJH65 TaxID=3344659 RepID=UPI0035F34192